MEALRKGMQTVNDILADNMRKARKNLGLSQLDLAVQSGLSIGYIGDLEAGKKFPSGRTIELLCDALHVRPYQLFLEEPETRPAPDRYQLLTSLRNELREKLGAEVDDLVNKYLDL